MQPHSTRAKQVGVFPCRGLVAPCQRTARSIKGLPLRCQTRRGGAVDQRQVISSRQMAFETASRSEVPAPSPDTYRRFGWVLERATRCKLEYFSRRARGYKRRGGIVTHRRPTGAIDPQPRLHVVSHKRNRIDGEPSRCFQIPPVLGKGFPSTRRSIESPCAVSGEQHCASAAARLTESRCSLGLPRITRGAICLAECRSVFSSTTMPQQPRPTPSTSRLNAGESKSMAAMRASSIALVTAVSVASALL